MAACWFKSGERYDAEAQVLRQRLARQEQVVNLPDLIAALGGTAGGPVSVAP